MDAPELKVLMVSQNNLDAVIGELEGVVRSSSKMIESYYTDTRASATLVYNGDGWVRGSFLRLVVGGREIGTFAVESESMSQASGGTTKTLELRSMLYLMSLDKADWIWTVDAGQKVSSLSKWLLGSCGRSFIDNGNDYMVTAPFSFESDTSALARLFALHDIAGNRVDLDGRGNIVISAYVEPNRRAPSYVIDLDDPECLAHDGIGFQTDWLSLPNRVSIVYRYSESIGGESVNREVAGSADMEGELSAASRGYVVSDLRVVNELEPPTAYAAQKMAQDILAGIGETAEWKLKLSNAPISAGDVVELRVNFGPERYQGARKCLVKAIDTELGFMTQTVTLKEV